MCFNYKVSVCFTCLGTPAKLYDTTNPDWAPTLLMGHSTAAMKAMNDGLQRYQRTAQRRQKQQMTMSSAQQDAANVIHQHSSSQCSKGLQMR